MSGRPSVVGVLLAGGQSRRMGGGDKCLRPLGGSTIIDHVLDRLRPQVGPLLLNANGEPARFASDAEVKRAYRRLIRENHPDRLAARGLPERAIRWKKTRSSFASDLVRPV